MLRTNLATGDFGDNFTIPKLEPLFIDEIKMHRNELKATFRVIFNDLNKNFVDFDYDVLEFGGFGTEQFCVEEYEVSFEEKEGSARS